MKRTTGGLSLYDSPDNDSLMKKSIRFVTKGLTPQGHNSHIPIITSHFESTRETGTLGRPHKSRDTIPQMYLAIPLFVSIHINFGTTLLLRCDFEVPKVPRLDPMQRSKQIHAEL